MESENRSQSSGRDSDQEKAASCINVCYADARAE